MADTCTCIRLPESEWLSAASCGYGSGYEPGSQWDYDPDCPEHGRKPTMADRQQHIDTLARLIGDRVDCTHDDTDLTMGGLLCCTCDAEAIFDSTDPAVHDALIAALHANADRARVLAAHAENGWLDDDQRLACPGCRSTGVVGHPVFGRIFHGPGCEYVGTFAPEEQRRYVSEWEALQ